MMKLTAVYICDQGRVRKRNQDNLYFHDKILRMRHKKARSGFSWKTSTEKPVCFGVFDGMGGEEYGEVASCLVAEIVKEKMKDCPAEKPPGDWLSEICHLANVRIYEKTRVLKARRMGTTAAMVYILHDKIWCCNVGDSRIYRMRGGILSQISFDHISEAETVSGKKPGLTQHLGMDPEMVTLFPHIMDDVTEPGDLYLLCSDGLTDMIPDMEIKDFLLRQISLRARCQLLLKKALEHGGRDNITMIILQLE